MKRVHCLLHVPFEGLGSLGTWLEEQGFALTHSRLFEGDALPEADDFDWLVVMGGPMSVLDEASYPWLKPEKALIHAALDKDRGVIGICLGAQLVAQALGSEVAPGESEIGWLPLDATPEGKGHPLGELFDGAMALHWHGDAFTLPEGATRLAATDATPNQAFVYGHRVLGLQFHLETTFEDAERMCRESHPGGRPSDRIQPPETILADPDRFLTANALMREVMEYMLPGGG